MRAEERSTCPFADLPSKQNGEWVQGITPGEMRKYTWVNPQVRLPGQIRRMDS